MDVEDEDEEEEGAVIVVINDMFAANALESTTAADDDDDDDDDDNDVALALSILLSLVSTEVLSLFEILSPTSPSPATLPPATLSSSSPSPPPSGFSPCCRLSCSCSSRRSRRLAKPLPFLKRRLNLPVVTPEPSGLFFSSASTVATLLVLVLVLVLLLLAAVRETVETIGADEGATGTRDGDDE